MSWETKKLDKEQLELLIGGIMGMTNRLSDLYQGILDNPGKFYKKMQEISKFCKRNYKD